MTTLTHPMSRMIEAAMSGNLSDVSATNRPSRQITPRADIMEGDTEFRVVMDLPGITTEDLNIQVENQTLSVAAKRSHQMPEGFELSRRERMGEISFLRNFNLGNAIDADSINARLENGVLMLTLPKSESSMPRRIEVQ